MSDGRPKAAAQIYKHGRLKTGKELEQERIRNLSFDELKDECVPMTQDTLNTIEELIEGVDVDLDKPLEVKDG